MKSNSLAVQTNSIGSTIKPPARKPEIIEALAIRKHAQLVEQAAKADADFKAAEAALNTLLQATYSAHLTEKPKIRIRSYLHSSNGYRPHVSISLENSSLDVYAEEFTPEMKKHHRTMERIETSRIRHVPEFKEIRRGIRDAMNGELSRPADRVQALLNDPETVKALDKTLNRLESANAVPALTN